MIELPGEADRVALEVVAEREVAEHLEEGVMPGGVAHLLEVVVLAAGAHALLRRGRAPLAVRRLLHAEEHLLELHHARVDEQQRGIVGGHERRSSGGRRAAAARSSRGSGGGSRRRACAEYSARRRHRRATNARGRRPASGDRRTTCVRCERSNGDGGATSAIRDRRATVSASPSASSSPTASIARRMSSPS